MAHRISVVAFDGISPFHLAVPTTVFGPELTRGLGVDYEVRVCAPDPGLLSTPAGYGIAVEHDLSILGDADTVILPSWHTGTEVPEELAGAVAAAHGRGARVVGLCVGAAVVAAAGVVDGREAVTHWSAAGWLQERFPAVRVRDDVLWRDHGDVVTSAGTVAALDCCLHLVRKDAGTVAGIELARRLVMAPHRDGSQAQFLPLPVIAADDPDDLGVAMAWAREHLAAPVQLQGWADAVAMSRRTLTRRFRMRTGTSPMQWLLEQRLEHARALLETTDAPIERVAAQAGLGSAVSLRRHFRERYAVSPRRHREAFRAR